MSSIEHLSIDEEVDLNSVLAIERTQMANYRTLLSFLRTSLYFSIAGLTIPPLIKLPSIWVAGITFWVVSGITFCIGLFQFFSMKKKIEAARMQVYQSKTKS